MCHYPFALLKFCLQKKFVKKHNSKTTKITTVMFVKKTFNFFLTKFIINCLEQISEGEKFLTK